MRLSGISRTGAIYDASASARTFETFGEFYVGEIDFSKNVTDASSEVLAKPGCSRIPGFDGFIESREVDMNNVNILKKI